MGELLELLGRPGLVKWLGVSTAAFVAVSGLAAAVGALLRARLGWQRGQLELEAFRIRLEEARIQVAEEQEQARRSWLGFRKFKVARRVVENEVGDICSFHLEPHDGRPLPRFRPGQHLVFSLDLPGQPRTIRRCYSLSDAPHEDHYRVTVKRVPAHGDHPPGLSSNHFHDTIEEGSILDVSAPAGEFWLNMEADSPVVLIGCGVGITPMLAMIEALAVETSARPTWLFYGMRTLAEAVQLRRLGALVREHANLHLWLCLSRPGEREQAFARAKHGVFNHNRRFSVEWALQAVIPPEMRKLAHYYVCGPTTMMEETLAELADAGIPARQLHAEDFGGKPPPAVAAGGPTCQVKLKRSGKSLTWDGSVADLLTLLDDSGIESVQPGCWRGSCHSCKTALIEGTVKYASEQFRAPEAGTILPCVCIPEGDIVLDA